MTVIQGGRRFYGVDVGIVLLDNTIPRPVGDVGHAGTFDFPVAYATACGAGTTHVVERRAEGLLDAVAAPLRELVAGGVRAIATCCGFLAIFQAELAERTGVPVAASSLLQIPMVLTTLAPAQRVCVLTVNGSTLSDDHFAAAGVTSAQRHRITVAGLEHTDHFYPMIVGKSSTLDTSVAEREIVAAATDAVAADPTIGAFVFECTNLPPYAAAVRRATNRPVWDAVTLIRWLRAGVTEQE